MVLRSLASDRVIQDLPEIAPVNVAQFPFSYMYFYAASEPVARQDIYVLFFQKCCINFDLKMEMEMEMFSFFLSYLKPFAEL